MFLKGVKGVVKKKSDWHVIKRGYKGKIGTMNPFRIFLKREAENWNCS
jgi:hypothetical protein